MTCPPLAIQAPSRRRSATLGPQPHPQTQEAPARLPTSAQLRRICQSSFSPCQTRRHGIARSRHRFRTWTLASRNPRSQSCKLELSQISQKKNRGRCASQLRTREALHGTLPGTEQALSKNKRAGSAVVLACPENKNCFTRPKAGDSVSFPYSRTIRATHASALCKGAQYPMTSRRQKKSLPGDPCWELRVKRRLAQPLSRQAISACHLNDSNPCIL